MRYILLILSLFLVGCSQSYQYTPNYATSSYSVKVEELKKQAQESFKEAEAKIFVDNPQPIDVVVGPDPDAAKCICKGTGIIVQGDGHKTACPYHSKSIKSK